MDNHDELQEFDLDDILSEFGASSTVEENSPPSSPMRPLDDTGSLADALKELELMNLPEEAAEAKESASAEALPDLTLPPVPPADTQEADPGFSASGSAEEDALLAQALKDLDLDEDSAISEDSTLRFDLQDAPDGETPGAEELSLEDVLQADTKTDIPPAESGFEEEETFIPAPIVFTPRSRLKELKKKLVAGPEKRYYALSEAGIGKLQAAIAVNLLIVLLCAGVTTMFTLDMVPENRLRLVIFSQVLAMLVSGLLGCNLMLDALGDLFFKGRFTVNTLLVLTFGVCIADSVFCLKELRVPCCAAFCLAMTMALWARYERHTTEMAQMDTMRKAVRLHGITKKDHYFEGKPGLLRTEAEVEDFMEVYNKPSAPETLQSFYAFLALVACIAISVFAGLQHGLSMAIQILSTSLLVAVPATFFVSITRPAAILEQRLHMVGSLLCGWQGVKALSGKAVFPIADHDLFPQGCTKLNGVKFYGSRSPDQVISYATSLITVTGGGLLPVFQQLLTSRNGTLHTVENFRNYGDGGIGGEVCGEPVLLGDMAFLQDMGVEIPEGTMVNQAVYAAIDGQLCAVFAISYAKMRSAAAGLVTLSGYRRLRPVMVGTDFMLTEEFIQAKFSVKTRRIHFPDWDTRMELNKIEPDPEAPILAISTREELISTAYTVTGARALRTSTRLGVAIHLIGGILGMLIMLILAILGNTELLIPTNILLYQLIWAVPGLLITEWTRTV